MEIGRPLVCINSKCRYFGNLNLDACPRCGEQLHIPSDAETKMLNRVARYSWMQTQTDNYSMILGREKTMIINAANEIVAENPEIIPTQL